jgi:hypothetical protein
MDNTLLSGIISSLATIVGAVIGAVATIGAALISKTYADKKISRSKATDEIRPLVRLIIQFLGLFRVTGASVFTVKKKKAFIDSATGITITLRSFHYVSDSVEFEYHLPGQLKPQRVAEANVGWKVLVNSADGLFALTLVDAEILSGTARFDFRKVNSVIMEADINEQVKQMEL